MHGWMDKWIDEMDECMERSKVFDADDFSSSSSSFA
jgi:hypothetical protein